MHWMAVTCHSLKHSEFSRYKTLVFLQVELYTDFKKNNSSAAKGYS